MLEFAKLLERSAELVAALATLETGVPVAKTRCEVNYDWELAHNGQKIILMEIMTGVMMTLMVVMKRKRMMGS